MNGLHRSYLHHLFVLFVIISGSLLPAIDYVWYRRKISANLTGRRNSADDRMPVTVHKIKDLSRWEYPVIESPVILKTVKNEISFTTLLEPDSYKLPAYLFQNGELKTAAIRNILVKLT